MRGLINVVGENDSFGRNRTGEIRGLVKFAGKPVILHTIDKMRETEVGKVLVLVNQKHVQEYGKALAGEKDITVQGCDVMSPFFAYMHGLKQLKGDDVLAVADDNLFDFSLTKLIKGFRRVDSNVLAVRDLEFVASADEVEKLNFGRVIIDDKGKVTSASFSFASQTRLKDGKIALDIYLIHRRRIPQFERMIAKGDLDYVAKNWWKDFYAIVINEGFWADIGKPELRRKAEEYFGKN